MFVTTTPQIAVLGVALAFAGAGPADAQVAGATRLGTTVTETEQAVMGWSAKQSILGRPLYNASGERLGKVLDLIVGNDKRVSFVVVDTGRTLRTAEHLVAVPSAQLQVRGARLVLPDAAHQTLAMQPAFVHAPITRTQSSVVERAQQEVDRARQAVAQLERRSAQSSGEAKVRIDRQILVLQQSQQAVEDKVTEMDRAGAAQWQAVEAEVGQASARLRSAIRNAST
ncbi:sporulation protein YlmC with PRC-barrel domain [Variovorax boronicumulans]|uniref:PRC-barrel domain-containing protein n=1 Tax=Variovorax boronicumulans TaxID=436515 RepID=UPI0027831631|nr:PRC-barrel domain-containing protein [Variovorax boronicumulans]MDQ0036874.1 sporulation protein YlmC with PRC-barrel domain [Variovorax boronicumulans]